PEGVARPPDGISVAYLDRPLRYPWRGQGRRGACGRGVGLIGLLRLAAARRRGRRRGGGRRSRRGRAAGEQEEREQEGEALDVVHLSAPPSWSTSTLTASHWALYTAALVPLHARA